MNLVKNSADPTPRGNRFHAKQPASNCLCCIFLLEFFCFVTRWIHIKCSSSVHSMGLPGMSTTLASTGDYTG